MWRLWSSPLRATPFPLLCGDFVAFCNADFIHERKHFLFCREIDHTDAGEINVHLNMTVTTGFVVVVYLNSGALQSCYSLTNITIPDGVTSIGSSVFQSC